LSKKPLSALSVCLRCRVFFRRKTRTWSKFAKSWRLYRACL